MLRKNIASEIKTNIDINSDEFIHNKNVMLKKTGVLVSFGPCSGNTKNQLWDMKIGQILMKNSVRDWKFNFP